MHGVGPGSLLGGRYVVQRRVAQHSRYERWTAADQTLDRDVVLLCFDSEGPVASAAMDAARRAAGVEEHRLVRVLDVGYERTAGNPSVAFVVEEPLTGSRSLTSALSDGGLPAEEGRRIVGESSSALERARARGLHHGVLTPRSVFLMPDGSVKVRGLATEAALIENDDVTPDRATRADTVALVALAYALLTGRWPLDGADSGLEAAPRVARGVAAPSEIAAGVPSDLDLLARTTLGEDHGPLTPGELAEQIRPWSPTPVAAGMSVPEARRTPGSRTEPLERDRDTGGVGRGVGRTGWGRRGDRSAAVAATAAGTVVTAGMAGTAGSAGGSAPSEAGRSEVSRSVLGVPFSTGAPETATESQTEPGVEAENGTHTGTEPEIQTGPYEEGDLEYDDGVTSRVGRATPAVGVAAAGSAVARGVGSALGAAGGLASSFGDRVGGLARGAADRAADRAAERSATRAERRQTEEYEDPGIFGEQLRLSEALEESDQELEPALPLLPGEIQEPLDRDQSRLVLLGIAAFVVVAAALGIWGLPKLSGFGVSANPAPVVTRTVTAAPGDGAATPAAPTTSQPPGGQPVVIASASQISQDGGVQSNKTTAAALDGDPDSVWRSAKWYGSPEYGGFTDSQVGLLLDLGQTSDVHTVSFSVRGPADVKVLVAGSPKVDGASTIGTLSGQDGDATVSVPNGGAVKGQYVILWFDTLGPDGEGHYRAQIAEVSVK